MGFRAPVVAAELFGASIAVGAWALLAAGALGGPVGLRVHRRGLLVLAAGLVGLAVARPHVELAVPCALAAAVLCRIGLARWVALEGEPDRAAVAAAPATGAEGGAGVPTAGVPGRPPDVTPSAARHAGRVAGRAGTVLGREASTALLRAARAAGRVAGRAREHPPPR